METVQIDNKKLIVILKLGEMFETSITNVEPNGIFKFYLFICLLALIQHIFTVDVSYKEKEKELHLLIDASQHRSIEEIQTAISAYISQVTFLDSTFLTTKSDHRLTKRKETVKQARKSKNKSNQITNQEASKKNIIY